MQTNIVNISKTKDPLNFPNFFNGQVQMKGKKTIGSESSRIFVDIINKDVVVIKKMIFSDKDYSVFGYKQTYTRFNKHIWEQVVSFKLETVQAILDSSKNIISKQTAK